MEKERLNRYYQKINFILEKISSLPPKATSSVEVDASLYRIEVALEATMDIIAMLIKDKGHTVSDDYHNIENLVTLKVVSSKQGGELKKLNGLRNAIVHKYNKFEEEVVLKDKEKIKQELIAFLKITENELHRFK